MKKRNKIALVITTCMVIAIFWPRSGNPFKYVHLKDSVRTSIPVALIFGEPCATYKDGTIEHDISATCYRFEKPRRFKGVWLYEFEGSIFLEGVTSVPSTRPSPRDAAWLMYDPANIDPKPDYRGTAKGGNCFPIHAFEVEFIGQSNPERHGHFGLFGSEIWVQKMLSAKTLPAPNCESY